MFMRFVLIVAAASAASAPVTVRYRIEQKTESKVDLSGFGQGEQVQNQNATWVVTLSYTDSAGGRVLHAVLDSMRMDGGMVPISPASIDSAKGTTYHGFLDAEWRLKSLTASKSSGLGAQFESTLRLLHPSVKRGAAAGATWVDTVDTPTKSPQADLKARAIRTFTMGGAEAYEGAQATRLDVALVGTVSGTLETPGGSAEMMGGGPGTGTSYLAPDGRFVGGKSNSVTEAIVTIASAPGPIPVKTTTATTVTVIKP
jgi:hypothetical protein